MKEILNGIGYGNVFIDGTDLVFTSTDCATNTIGLLLDVIYSMSKDLSDLINIPTSEIINDYVVDCGGDLMHEAFESVTEKYCKKNNKPYVKIPTLTHECIKHTKELLRGDIND